MPQSDLQTVFVPTTRAFGDTGQKTDDPMDRETNARDRDLDRSGSDSPCPVGNGTTKTVDATKPTTTKDQRSIRTRLALVGLVACLPVISLAQAPIQGDVRGASSPQPIVQSEVAAMPEEVRAVLDRLQGRWSTTYEVEGESTDSHRAGSGWSEAHWSAAPGDDLRTAPLLLLTSGSDDADDPYFAHGVMGWDANAQQLVMNNTRTSGAGMVSCYQMIGTIESGDGSSAVMIRWEMVDFSVSGVAVEITSRSIWTFQDDGSLAFKTTFTGPDGSRMRAWGFDRPVASDSDENQPAPEATPEPEADADPEVAPTPGVEPDVEPEPESEPERPRRRA